MCSKEPSIPVDTVPSAKRCACNGSSNFSRFYHCWITYAVKYVEDDSTKGATKIVYCTVKKFKTRLAARWQTLPLATKFLTGC